MVKLYRVGGAVRDKFLNPGMKPKDIDYAVEASSFEEMVQYIQERGKIFLSKPEYFTIRAKVNKEDADFVLCRKESGYTDCRRPDSVSIGDIYDDLGRRDFTMNAIAIDDYGTVIDPYNGRADIDRALIRCVGKTEDRFNEDALRMIRAIRFAITKEMTLSEDIHYCLLDYEFVKKLENVSVERIREEMNRCFNYSTKQTFHKMQSYDLMFDFIFGQMDMKLKATMEHDF